MEVSNHVYLFVYILNDGCL